MLKISEIFRALVIVPFLIFGGLLLALDPVRIGIVLAACVIGVAIRAALGWPRPGNK